MCSASRAPGVYVPLGCPAWQAITTTSAIGFGAFAGGISAGATLVNFVPSVAIVLRDDGGAPTAAGPGVPIPAGSFQFYYANAGLSGVQFIAQSASGTIAACFYK